LVAQENLTFHLYSILAARNVLVSRENGPSRSMKMDKQAATRLRMVELQNEALISEDKMLTPENEMLTLENGELRNMLSELQQSLDEAVRMSRQQTAEHKLEPTTAEASEDTAACTHVSISQDVCDLPIPIKQAHPTIIVLTRENACGC